MAGRQSSVPLIYTFLCCWARVCPDFPDESPTGTSSSAPPCVPLHSSPISRQSGLSTWHSPYCWLGFSMRVIVFGSTGTTGRQAVRKLLFSPDGHTVVAVARNPAVLDDLKTELEKYANRLIVMKGDLMDAESVATAVRGADVVVFTAGVASIKQAAMQKTTVYSVGGKNVLDAMTAAGVNRLVAVTSQGVVSDPAEALVYRYILKPLLMADLYEDMRRLERQIAAAAEESSLSYTILRPTKLEDHPIGDRKPMVGEGFLPKGSTTKVERADLADLIVAVVQDEAVYRNKTLYIST